MKRGEGTERHRRERPEGAPRRRYSLAEYVADALIHALSLAFGIGAVIALWTVTFPIGSGTIIAGVVLYAVGLIAMVTCSALYNLTRVTGRLKVWLRRFDHAAIFVMIAGTYSPLFLAEVGGRVGITVFVLVWLLAAAGAVLKIAWGPRFERLSVALYLGLGWIGVVAIGPLIDALALTTLALIGIGGLLYTAGVGFYLAKRLPFHNALWHLFVILAAASQFTGLIYQVLLSYPA